MKKTLTSVLIGLVVVAPAVASQYMVKSGDTLNKIAESKGYTVEQILEMNPQVKNKNLIYPGQRLNFGDEAVKTVVAEKKAEVNEKVAAAKSDAEEKAAKAKEDAAKAKKEADDKIATVKKSANEKCDACDNVLNGNPMYRPNENRFYSITTLGTNTDAKDWMLNEHFGYGITNNLSVFLDTNVSTHKFESDSFDWNNLALGMSYRALNVGNWKGDVYGKLSVNMGVDDWWHSDNTYTWTVGTKIGYSTCLWTLNGLFEYNYLNDGAFNWDETGLRDYRAGIEGQIVLNKRVNFVASATYEMPEFADNYYTGKIGMNVNIDTTKYVGLYVFQELHDGDFDDATGLALQFGIDF
ncbi:LysM peptidoglycan-binding domain-containing protein [Lachnospiraceae bacterium OttesenSCG-928-E19]|nr:LysM peptidoglycan-binding domain-containing protein [Lachnospiraceae bacterium OttesenSCG-928-E19]